MSHGLVTLLKYPRHVPGREAVTVLRYIVLGVCLIAPFLAAPVAAAPVEERRELDDRKAAFSVEKVEYDTPFLEEYCVPGFYRILCVGPVVPQAVDVPLGETGAGFATNDTLALAIVDRDRVQAYGPYIVQMPVGDDVRVCYFTCLMPYPVYLYAQANATADVWLLGQHAAHREVKGNVTVGHEEGLPLPPPFGCDRWQSQCE